ncbi:MAG TPA: response regulator transcription factor [Puia sp.]|nr:response regulator transcription factor [Puia sp.]
MPGKSILIVDDSPLISEKLRLMLKPMKNIETVGNAGDYQLALRWITENRPDIVLLDINLPGRSGIDLLQYIKTHDPGIVVIMLTNQSGEYYRAKCKALGADFFMDKSREYDQVPAIISSIL